jgi:hypothetical protein
MRRYNAAPLPRNNGAAQPLIALISAGRDRTFETSCNAFVDANADGQPDTPLIGRVTGSDDVIRPVTYNDYSKLNGAVVDNNIYLGAEVAKG